LQILVTGASGFVGSKTCPYLSHLGYKVTAFSRSSCSFNSAINLIKSESLATISLLDKSFQGIDCVIHLAGRAHFNAKHSSKKEIELFKDNVTDTIKFASHCAEKSVKRFIFISSIKVNGESTNNSNPFNEKDIPKPKGAYAISKYQTELRLLEIAKNSTMEVVIIRPPLIYGYGVKGYFGNLLWIIKKGIPLPFGSITNNLRSFIYLENFLNFLDIVIKHPKAANNIFICSDQNDISTAELLTYLYEGMHEKSSLFRISPFILKKASYLIRKGNLYEKISNSLVVNSSKATSLLGWNPAIDFPFAIKKVAQEYYIKSNSS
tara:strand:- start:72 stop:1034 length:963 start_codon:yes stop_codon:yes gene_type:complete